MADVKFRLESGLDVMNLNEVYETGYGVQVLSGATGLGLPPVSIQWQEGAGDGAVFRGQRATPRDIDLPIVVVGRDRTHLKQVIGKYTQMLARSCRLVFVDDDGTEWFTEVHRTGGGSFNYGQDTDGLRELRTVISLRSGDPYFTAVKSKTITAAQGSSALPFVSNLSKLPVASSQVIGSFTMDNVGDAPAYPIWTVQGPATNPLFVSPTGQAFGFEAVIAAGETRTIDTRTGSVTDQTGASCYAELLPAPEFWPIPPGRTTGNLAVDGSDNTTKITCSFQPRRQGVI